MKLAMKSVAVEASKVTVRQLMARAARRRVVFLTDKGRTKCAVVPADDFDQEIAAQRANPELMAFLDRRFEEARKAPGKPIEEVRREFGLPPRPARRKS